MKHFVIVDFETIVDCNSFDEIPERMGYASFEEMEEENGGTELEIHELSEEDYRFELDYGTYDII